MKILKCPDLVLQSVLLTTILLDLGVDIFHQRVPLHQHVSERGTGEDTHHLGMNIKRKKRQTGNRRKNLEHKRPLSWEVATRPNFQQIFCRQSPHLGALPVLQKVEPLFLKSAWFPLKGGSLSVGGFTSTRLPHDVWINGFGGNAIALWGFVVALLPGPGEYSPNSQPVQKY